jgi:hypothetical protein
MQLGQEWSPYHVLGMSPAGQHQSESPAGETLPSSSHTGHDRGALPWHPDSPGFWLVLVGVATVLGVFGASFNVRAGKGKAGVSVGSA